MQISVITTVRNEERSIAVFLESLLAQTHPPDEIVVADGGSTDRTVEIARQYSGLAVPVRVLVAPGNISTGRNAAIRAACHEVIACTDAGCVPDRQWLENITRPFEENADVSVVSGYMQGVSSNLLQDCTQALMLSTVDEIDPDQWLPSSRSVAFLKSAWLKVGGYPDWLDIGEDTAFDKALLAAGYKFHFAPNAVVYWEPRPDLSGFARQYFGYSRGDGQAGQDATAHYRRTARVLLAALALLISLRRPRFLLPAAMLAGWYFTRRCLKVFKRLRSTRAFFFSWLLAATYDLASIAGFWRGALDRYLDRRYRERR